MKAKSLSIIIVVAFCMINVEVYSSIIDQQQVEVDGTVGFRGAGRVAQTFNAGISGQLELIEFGVTDNSDDHGDLYVQIRETESGAPKDTILAEILVQVTDQQVSDYSTTYVWAFGDFLDESIELTAGEQYALVVYTTSYDWTSHVLANFDHPYNSGKIWGFSSSTNQWAPYIDTWTHEEVDMCFRTTMVPEPTTAVLMISGLAFLIRKRK